jgi:hypothetical protein
VTTMVVVVNLKEGVSPEDYERWAKETYAAAVKALPSILDWQAYWVGACSPRTRSHPTDTS